MMKHLATKVFLYENCSCMYSRQSLIVKYINVIMFKLYMVCFGCFDVFMIIRFIKNVRDVLVRGL